MNERMALFDLSCKKEGQNQEDMSYLTLCRWRGGDRVVRTKVKKDLSFSGLFTNDKSGGDYLLCRTFFLIKRIKRFFAW